jgi:hypothetical protein
VDGEHISVITLSVLDLPSADLVDGEDGITKRKTIPEIPTTFTRPVVYMKPMDPHFSLTPDGHVLVSQPKSSKSVIWALAPPDPDTDSSDSDEPAPRGSQIQSLVLAHFPSFEPSADDGAVSRLERIEESSTRRNENNPPPSTRAPYDFEAPLEPRGNITTIPVDEWLPIDDKAMDMDLDDTYGRVAFGMKSGKVIILEFV